VGAQAAVLEVPWYRAWSHAPAEPHPSRSLDELLRAPWAAPRRANPELVKIMGFVRDEVGEASRLRAKRKQLDATVEHDLKAALETADIRSIDRGWEVWGALKRLNLLLGDRSYIAGLLEHERAHVHDETHWHTWDQHFDPRELHRLLTAYRKAPRVSPSQRATAVDRLTALYLKRAEAGRNRRTRAAVKELYLNRLAAALLVILVCLAASADMSSTRSLWREFLVAACAGALGSTLSGVLKLRDRLVKLDDLRAFRAAMRVQPVVGASAGALVFILLSSHAVAVNNLDPAIWSSPGLLGFAAGFSEPFFIGLVDRIAVIPDKSPEKTSAEQPAPQPGRAAPKRTKPRR
jgi:hypothetical protein